MPLFEITTTSLTTLTYQVEADNADEAIHLHKSGKTTYIGCVDAEETIEEIRQVSNYTQSV